MNVSERKKSTIKKNDTGEQYVIRLLETRREFFSLKLIYDGTGRLKTAILDGNPI